MPPGKGEGQRRGLLLTGGTGGTADGGWGVSREPVQHSTAQVCPGRAAGGLLDSSLAGLAWVRPPPCFPPSLFNLAPGR